MIVTVKTSQIDLQATEVAEALEEKTGFVVYQVTVINSATGETQDEWHSGRVNRT